MLMLDLFTSDLNEDLQRKYHIVALQQTVYSTQVFIYLDLVNPYNQEPGSQNFENQFYYETGDFFIYHVI